MFDLDDRDHVWADVAPRLYAQAVAAQWDPATAIHWTAPIDHPDDVEAAVVQVMTYLIENEQAALVVPARFLGRVHPYFREVMQLLAVQVADEARHVEVFTRRALLRRDQLGVSGAGGRASLGTLLDEPDFSIATFLLSVLGEGTFLNLLSFLERHAPDPVTRSVARAWHCRTKPATSRSAWPTSSIASRSSPSCATACAPRSSAATTPCRDTAGLNQHVFDALVVLAAGSWEPDAIAPRATRAVETLQADMDDGRRRRLGRLGFPPQAAAELAALHTRNFM